MSSPLVSVVIPLYNVAPYLKQCLDSVLDQSYENLEILLINDGSTDTSGQIAQEYASRGSKGCKIRYFEQENGGQSSARNLGLEHAQGEYVSFIDADDYIDRDFIKELVAVAAPDTLAYNFNIVYEYKHTSKRHNSGRVILGKFAINQQVISSIDFSASNELFCMKLIRDSGLRFLHGKVCEDANFLFCYLALVEYIHCIDSSAYHYRKHEGSTTWHHDRQRIVPLDRIDAFRHAALWAKKHGVLHRGLPLQILYELLHNHSNADEFMTKAKQALRELQIPQELLAKDATMQQFMQAKDSRDFFLRRYVDSARGFKRYFRLRIKPEHGEILLVCFGRVLLYYKRQ